MRMAVLIGCLLLAACTHEGMNPIARAGMAQLAERVRGPQEAETAAPAVLTRADIEATGAAAIRARLIDGGRPALLYGVVENAGVVTFASPLREMIGLRGGQLATTRGLGHDLLMATSSPNDPLVRPVPPQSWPARVERTFEFPANAPRGRIERYACAFEFGEVSTIAILTAEHRGVEITETCRGPAGEFENLHFVDLATGFVWRSIQWSGPAQGHIDVEIIVPRSG